jgi:hypothetical protein
MKNNLDRPIRRHPNFRLLYNQQLYGRSQIDFQRYRQGMHAALNLLAREEGSCSLEE